MIQLRASVLAEDAQDLGFHFQYSHTHQGVFLLKDIKKQPKNEAKYHHANRWDDLDLKYLNPIKLIYRSSISRIKIREIFGVKPTE